MPNMRKMDNVERGAMYSYGFLSKHGAPFYAGIATVVGGPVAGPILGAAVYAGFRFFGNHLIDTAKKGEIEDYPTDPDIPPTPYV